MQINTEDGTMTILKNSNTTIAKEKNTIKGLEELIEHDKKINDLKSLKYHSIALKQSKETLKELEKEAKK